MKRNVKRHAVIQPLDQSIKHIALTRGFTAVVDAADYPLLSQSKWIAGMRTDGKAYAYSSKKHGPSMHRLIIGGDSTLWVDHINGDTLDNRRSNLRLVTGAQSNMNRRVRRDSKTGFKGISLHHSGLYYRAAIHLNKKTVHLGYHRTAEEAARAYDAAAKQHFGEFAHLNFP